MPELTAADRERRRKGLGASDAAGIFGLGYSTPFSVWADKLWGHEVPTTPYMQRGHDLEPLVAAKFEQRHGFTSRVGGHTPHPDVPWLFATTDYRTGRPDSGLIAPLECKTDEAHWNPHKWGPDGDVDGVPDYIDLQVHQQIEVCRSSVAWIAVLLIDRWELRTYEIEPDPKVIDLLLEGAEAFWHDHVLARVPPPITDPAKDWNALKSVPLDVEREVELPADTADLVVEWRRARQDRVAAEAIEAEAKAEIARLMGGAGKGLIDGEHAVTASEHYRGSTLVRKLTDNNQWRHP